MLSLLLLLFVLKSAIPQTDNSHGAMAIGRKNSEAQPWQSHGKKASDAHLAAAERLVHPRPLCAKPALGHFSSFPASSRSNLHDKKKALKIDRPSKFQRQNSNMTMPLSVPLTSAPGVVNAEERLFLDIIPGPQELQTVNHALHHQRNAALVSLKLAQNAAFARLVKMALPPPPMLASPASIPTATSRLSPN